MSAPVDIYDFDDLTSSLIIGQWLTVAIVIYLGKGETAVFQTEKESLNCRIDIASTAKILRIQIHHHT